MLLAKCPHKCARLLACATGNTSSSCLLSSPFSSNKNEHVSRQTSAAAGVGPPPGVAGRSLGSSRSPEARKQGPTAPLGSTPKFAMDLVELIANSLEARHAIDAEGRIQGYNSTHNQQQLQPRTKEPYQTYHFCISRPCSCESDESFAFRKHDAQKRRQLCTRALAGSTSANDKTKTHPSFGCAIGYIAFSWNTQGTYCQALHLDIEDIGKAGMFKRQTNTFIVFEQTQTSQSPGNFAE